MLLKALAVLVAAGPLAAQSVEARSAHFRVVTTVSPIVASAAVTRLERTRAYLAALGFPVSLTRTEVVVFADADQMRPYAPTAETAGFFQQGTDTSFIAVAWNAAGDSYRALAHEAAHQAMASIAGRHPPWLREGLAELLSNVESVEGGLKIGAPIVEHVEAARRGAGSGYAQNWLLAHRLVVGQPFSGTLAQRLEALGVAERREIEVSEKLPIEIVPAAPQALAPPVVRILDAWEWEHRLAEVLRARNLVPQAREALIGLQARFPDRPEPRESLGALEMDALNYDLAEEHLAEAVRLGSVNAWTHYRYSLMLLRPGGPPELAARHARRAVELDPAQPLFWLTRAHAEMQLSRWEAARASLGELRGRAGDPLLREQVRVELAEIDRRREQQGRGPLLPRPPERLAPIEEPPPPPSVSPPPAPAPAKQQPTRHPGTLTFWGYLRRVECGDGEKILTVSNRIFSIRVRERAGAPARLHDPPEKWRQIPCTLKNVEVNVVYRPAAQFGPVNGDLVALIF